MIAGGAQDPGVRSVIGHGPRQGRTNRHRGFGHGPQHDRGTVDVAETAAERATPCRREAPWRARGCRGRISAAQRPVRRPRRQAHRTGGHHPLSTVAPPAGRDCRTRVLAPQGASRRRGITAVRFRLLIQRRAGRWRPPVDAAGAHERSCLLARYAAHRVNGPRRLHRRPTGVAYSIRRSDPPTQRLARRSQAPTQAVVQRC